MKRLLVFDTGPVVGLAARSALGQAIRERHFASARGETPLISIVTVAECRSIATYHGWGQAKRERLEELLAAFTIVGLLPNSPLVQKYAELYSFLRTSGRNWEKNQNDLWIASLAAVSRATLVTTDFKLKPLVPKFLEAETYDPATGVLADP